MILRYKAGLGGKPEITIVASNTLTSQTANTANYSIVINGPKLCAVGFKVTIYSAFGSDPEMSINSTDYVLDGTFSVTLDSSGAATLSQYLKINNTTGNVISVQITIVSVSKGTISDSEYFWDNTKNV